MIALYVPAESSPTLNLQVRFKEMLPTIQQVAKFAFRRIRSPERADLIAEVIANAFVAFHRLVARGKLELAYPSALAWFAVRQVREGRRVGSRRSVRDTLSSYAQRRKGFHVKSLTELRSGGGWQELVVEDRHATPADVASIRLDFEAWLKRLDRRRRRIALKLAEGETTTSAARHFSVSQARVSQLRRELRDSWQAFQGEEPPAAA